MHYFTDLLNGESNETCKKNVYEKEACFWDFFFSFFYIKQFLFSLPWCSGFQQGVHSSTSGAKLFDLKYIFVKTKMHYFLFYSNLHISLWDSARNSILWL